MSISDFNLRLPFPDVFPKEWDAEMKIRDFVQFRNLDHFRHEVSMLTQKQDEQCGMTYAKALEMLMLGQTDLTAEAQSSIRNLVRSNLHKRGLITEEVYENYRYTTDGTNVGLDVGKFANGEPDCVLSPSHQYIDFFYELYVSISYPYMTSNEQIRNTVAKLLATIEELERKHIFIKITLVLPITNIRNDDSEVNFFSTIPVFSHKEQKSVSTMSSVLNDRLLRKFYFAVLENLYKENLSSGYGYAKPLIGTMNVGNEFNEIEFFEEVLNSVGA